MKAIVVVLILINLIFGYLAPDPRMSQLFFTLAVIIPIVFIGHRRTR